MPKAEIDLIKDLTLVIIKQIKIEKDEKRRLELIEDLEKALQDKK